MAGATTGERPAGRPAPSRAAAKEAAARAALEPLAPGERPGAVTIAALVAVALAVSNVVLMVAGYDLRGQKGSQVGTNLVFAALMLGAGVGMWRMRYWAVLGFQALLAIVVLVFTLLLVRASTVFGVVVCVSVVGLGGWLFFKLIRAMSRIQMPSRPGV